jgi:hypothetical protein
MSVALDDVCKILNVADEAGRERELLAKNIIAFAHQGQRDAPLLRSHAEGDHLWSRRVACGARPRRASRGAVRFLRTFPKTGAISPAGLIFRCFS